MRRNIWRNSPQPGLSSWTLTCSPARRVTSARRWGQTRAVAPGQWWCPWCWWCSVSAGAASDKIRERCHQSSTPGELSYQNYNQIYLVVLLPSNFVILHLQPGLVEDFLFPFLNNLLCIQRLLIWATPYEQHCDILTLPPFTRVTFYSYLNVLFTSIQSQQNIDWKRWVWNIRQLWKHFNCCSGQVNHCQSMTRVEVIKLDKIIKLQLLVKYVSMGRWFWGVGK